MSRDWLPESVDKLWSPQSSKTAQLTKARELADNLNAVAVSLFGLLQTGSELRRCETSERLQNLLIYLWSGLSFYLDSLVKTGPKDFTSKKKDFELSVSSFEETLIACTKQDRLTPDFQEPTEIPKATALELLIELKYKAEGRQNYSLGIQKSYHLAQ